MDVRLVYAAADMDASVPVIFLAGEDETRVLALAGSVRREKLRCALAAVPVEDWNRQLSPWPAKAVFRGAADFAGEADAFLAELTAQCPGILAAAGSARACLMGYSLAGLFALYAAAKTDAFEKIAALSPSVWYPGFVDFFAAHLPQPRTECYLSLGKKEEKAGNAVLRTVGDNLRRVQALLGGDTPLVIHDGGHYTDGEKRMMTAIRWMCKDAPCAACKEE